ncbi:MAG: shikimate dehydrogenase [Syntrophales bacterium]
MKENKPCIFALFGNPVEHSLSPLMHNAAYREMGLDAIYVPFCVENLPDAVKAVRTLGIRGVSVTLPFKTAVMQYLDAVDETAKAVGAVNTILNESGTLTGFNTDWAGLTHALAEHLEIKGKTFAVIGAGGAARAAVFAVRRGGGTPLIYNRTEHKGRELAGLFGCRSYPLSSIADAEADCLIHATPVGMFPDTTGTPVPVEVLSRFRWVMDMIYNPLKTKFLKDAEKAGCKVISGCAMFVHQGAEQIRIWTAMEPPRALMAEVVVKKLNWSPPGIDPGKSPIIGKD